MRFPERHRGQRLLREARSLPHRPDWVARRRSGAGATRASSTTPLQRPGDADLAGPARRPRAPPVAVARRRDRDADGARLRPRPRRAGDILDCCRVGCACASCSRASAWSLPEDLGLQGPPGLRAAEHRGQLRADEAVRPRGRPGAGASRARAGRLAHGEEARKGKVLVDWSQNDRTRPPSPSTRCAAGSGRGLHPAAIGRRSRRSPAA